MLEASLTPMIPVSNILTLRTLNHLGNKTSRGPFQIEAPDPSPPNKQRTDLGKLVFMSSIDSVTYFKGCWQLCSGNGHVVKSLFECYHIISNHFHRDIEI